MTTTLANVVTFVGSVAIGAGAAIAIASAAAVSHEAPVLRGAPAPAAIVRLEPVVVTISKARYDAIRKEAAAESMIATGTAKSQG